ncbi:MAG: hypothetical protein ACEQSX_02440 [Baekduiaceae bacterium]
MTPGSSASNLPAPRDAEPPLDEYEPVDAVPVLDTPREIQPVSVAPLARQAAAVAATSFLCGATAIVLVRGRRARRHRIKLRGGRRRGQKVVSSHSFLVDVHVLGR